MTKIERIQISLAYCNYMTNGIIALSIGSIIPYLIQVRSLSLTMTGMLISLHSVGNLIAGFASGILPKWIGRRITILLFSSCTIFAYLIMVYKEHSLWLCVAFFMTGLARGGKTNFNNALINEIAPGKVWAMNLLHSLFGIGAFITPVCIMWVMGNVVENVFVVCYILSIVGIFDFLTLSIIPLTQSRNLRDVKKQTGLMFVKEKRFIWGTSIMFCYLCAEQGTIGWLVSYFIDTKILSASQAQLMSSMLWFSIIVGRFSCAWLSTRIKKESLLKGMSIGFIVFFLVVLFSRQVNIIIIGILGFGFSMAGIYPTVVSLMGDYINKYTMAWNLMLPFSTLGAILMPTIIGVVASFAGIITGVGMIVFAVVMTQFTILKFCAYNKEKSMN